MDLVSGDFLICRWAGKGLTQRAEEITLSWEGKGATLGKGVGLLSRTVQREILELRPCPVGTLGLGLGPGLEE